VGCGDWAVTSNGSDFEQHCLLWAKDRTGLII
jgi:hypothetical protein